MNISVSLSHEELIRLITQHLNNKFLPELGQVFRHCNEGCQAPIPVEFTVEGKRGKKTILPTSTKVTVTLRSQRINV